MIFTKNKKIAVCVCAFVCFAIFAVCLFWGMFVETERLGITRVEIPVRQWAGTKKYARLVVAADFHFAPGEAARAEKIVSMMLGENPDAVLLLGDYVKGHRNFSTMPLDEIAHLLAPLAAGTPCFAVLGNHDAYIGNARVKAALDSVGIYTFREAGVKKCVLRNGDEILFGGTLDAHSYYEILSPGCVPENGTPDALPFVLLTHSPDIIPYLNRTVDFTVCGHTHGGQICLPGGIPLVSSTHRAAREYVYGLHDVPSGGKIFTTRGLGTSLLPIRFFCEPEILVVDLVPAE